MRYYIRQNKDAVIQGPCTVPELLAGITAGDFGADTLVSSDLGDTLADLRTGRHCDWFPLRDVSEAGRLLPPPPKSEPDPPRPVSLRYVVFQTVLALLCLGVAFAEQRWFVWVIAGLMVWEAGTALGRYTKQQPPRGEVV
ncbi:MAG TPA: hypothetical protein VL527_04290 [Dongiaceae bacterium]|nr:hypothetical protein [Dongiaceae bacterium]